jgi:hypothetical protein
MMTALPFASADRAAWLPFGLGHNGGPPLDDHTPPWGDAIGTYFDWQRAHRRAWKGASRSVTLFRLARAETVGLTYKEYVAEMLDTGRWLQADDAARIAAIKAARPAAEPAPPSPPIPRADPPAGESTVIDPHVRRLMAVKRQRPRWR